VKNAPRVLGAWNVVHRLCERDYSIIDHRSSIIDRLLSHSLGRLIPNPRSPIHDLQSRDHAIVDHAWRTE